MIRFALLLLTAISSTASAHHLEGGPDGSAWTFDPTLTVPIGLVLLLFGLGLFRLWRRAGIGRGLPVLRAVSFACGWVVLALALISPVHAWSERSFAMHMIEHELLMIVAAPLLALSLPAPALLWGLPKSWRIAFGKAGRSWAGDAGRWVLQPLPATVLHGVAIWVWHVPAFFQAAVEHEGLHWLQHLSFFGSALIFWWALFRPVRRGEGLGENIAHLFVTSVHTGLLGAVLAVSARLWYAPEPGTAILWGLTPLEDQQLAGLIMWIPGGTIYAAAALYFAGRWIAGSGHVRGGGLDHAIAGT